MKRRVTGHPGGQAVQSTPGAAPGCEHGWNRGRAAALFHASAVFPDDAVTIDGETRDYQGRYFCPRCGSSVFSRSADEIEVNLGSLDAPDQLIPTYELWTVRRESWLPPFPHAKRYERDRDNPERSEE